MSYVGVPPFGQTVETVTEKTAIDGQTTFSPDGGYMPGYVTVLINGVELASSDYTATNGTTIILNVACTVGDEFKSKAKWPVSMVDTYRKGEMDTALAAKLATDAGAVGTNNLAAGAVTAAKMASGAARANFGAGAVLQVIQAVKTDTFSTTSNTPVDVTGLSASITPSSASSKILVLVDCSFAGGASAAAIAFLAKNGSVIYGGDASTGRVNGLAWGYNVSDYDLQRSGGTYLDTPNTTSPITYNVKLSSTTAGTAAYVNRSVADRANTYFDVRTASSITLMEIAG